MGVYAFTQGDRRALIKDDALESWVETVEYFAETGESAESVLKLAPYIAGKLRELIGPPYTEEI